MGYYTRKPMKSVVYCIKILKLSYKTKQRTGNKYHKWKKQNNTVQLQEHDNLYIKTALLNSKLDKKKLKKQQQQPTTDTST